MSDKKKPTATAVAGGATAVAGGATAVATSIAISGGKSSAKKGSCDSLRWIPASNGDVPPSAVPGGVDLTGRAAYVGRVKYLKYLIPGRVVPHKGQCVAAILWEQCPNKNYEVLTNPENAPLKWVSTKFKKEKEVPVYPPGAVPAGDQNGETMYVGRCNVEGKVLVGKVHSREHEMFVPMNDTEKRFLDFELLVCEQ